MPGRMVRGAVFTGGSFTKFVSSTPEQINLNQIDGANDWRIVPDTVLTPAAVDPIDQLIRDALYDNPYI